MYVKVLLLQGSFWDLLSQSSLFARLIILILAIMSLVSWAVIINKWRAFRRANADSRRFMATFRRKGRLADMKAKLLTYNRSPLAKVFSEGFAEYELLSGQQVANPSLSRPLSSDQMEAIGRVLERETTVQISNMERNVSFLATTGNVAPFFGLLGTCWGIMYAFWNIGIEKSASLVVVAPGIAEALIATIFGLAVAIPAVMGFNWCNTRLKFLADDMDSFSLEFLSLVNREQNNL
jgi:biopolymer transport protein TolQ